MALAKRGCLDDLAQTFDCLCKQAEDWARLKIKGDKISIRSSSVDFFDKKRKQVYQMSKKFRGLVLILDIQEKPESEDPEELSTLHKMWAALNYRVVEKANLKELTSKGIKQILRRFSEDPHHVNAQACVICVLGLQAGATHQVLCSDGSTISVWDIVACVDNDHCPALKTKPKLIFVDTCYLESDNDEQISDPEISPQTDTFICLPSVSGKNKTGYLNTLMTFVQEQAHDTPLIRIIMDSGLTGEKEDGSDQVIAFKSKLKKPLYFFPGLWT